MSTSFKVRKHEFGDPEKRAVKFIKAYEKLCYKYMTCHHGDGILFTTTDKKHIKQHTDELHKKFDMYMIKRTISEKLN